MASGEHFRKLEAMYLKAPINDFYRPTIEVTQGRCEISLEVRRDFYHAADAVHGSVYFKLMDDAAFFAANSQIEDAFVLTTSFNVYFTQPVSQGVITGIGTGVFRASRLLIAEARVVNQRGDEIGRGSGTFMKSAIPLDGKIGYG